MKFLIIRFKQIGDVVLTSVLCNSIKQAFPEAKVDYLVHGVSAPMLEGQPFVDEVIGLSAAERKSPLKFFRKVREIAKNNYDVIIDATSTARSGWFSLLSRKAKYRIGRDKGKAIHFHTHLVPEKVGYKVDQRLSMLQPLIDDGYNIKPIDRLHLQVDETALISMRHALTKSGINLDKPIFVFSVSSRISYKKWKLDYQAEVAKHCIAKYGAQIVLYSGAPHEMQDGEEFCALVDHSENVFNNIATPTLKDLMALIGHANLFIGNECGPMHIAQALGVPTVTVFSPFSDLEEWAPSNNPRFRSIDWIGANPHAAQLSNTRTLLQVDSDEYTQAYNGIRPEHVIAMVDDVVESCLNLD